MLEGIRENAPWYTSINNVGDGFCKYVQILRPTFDVPFSLIKEKELHGCGFIAETEGRVLDDVNVIVLS